MKYIILIYEWINILCVWDIKLLLMIKYIIDENKFLSLSEMNIKMK